MTIIRDISAYRTFPYVHLDSEALASLVSACQTEGERHSINSLTKSLECFLQITNTFLTLKDIQSPASDKQLMLFRGALHSEKFRELTTTRRIFMTTLLDKLICRLRGEEYNIPRRTNGDALVNRYPNQTAEFEALALEEEKVWLWTAWPCENASGQLTNLPLLPFYKRFGRPFTEKLYRICATFLATRRASRIRAITSMSCFVDSNECQSSAKDILNARGSTMFFDAFWVHYYKSCVLDNIPHAHAISTWRQPIMNFIRTQILESGLFATPHEIANPEPENPPGADSHVIEKDGIEYKNKLLVKIPMHISDDEAFNLIKKRIYRSIEIVNQWCDIKINEAKAKVQASQALAKEGLSVVVGEPSKCSAGNYWLLSPENPKFINNLAATLHELGYDALRKAINSYNVNSTGIGDKLGIASTDSLLPFCLKLIKLNPSITPAFLSSIELYDKNGRLRGIESGDIPTYIHGYKDRRNPENAEMRIKLNDESIDIVATIIRLTSHLRSSLKASNDDAWRSLLLTAKNGTGKPQRYRCKTNNSKDKTQAKLQELKLLFPAEEELNTELSQSLLRPATMRSTAGVIVFLETGSVYAMADALGHTKYESDLLERYLPKSILYFFRDRWVRKFQTGIIVQAMKGSKHLLRASSFNSMGELDAFLEHYTINFMPTQHPTSISTAQEGNPAKAVISLNIEIARILVTITHAKITNGSKLNAKAEHWASFSQLLINYLENDPDNQLEALDLFDQAKKLGPIEGLERVIYEHP